MSLLALQASLLRTAAIPPEVATLLPTFLLDYYADTTTGASGAGPYPLVSAWANGGSGGSAYDLSAPDLPLERQLTGPGNHVSLYGVNYHYRLQSAANVPLTGTSARTMVVVFRPTAGTYDLLAFGQPGTNTFFSLATGGGEMVIQTGDNQAYLGTVPLEATSSVLVVAVPVTGGVSLTGELCTEGGTPVPFGPLVLSGVNTLAGPLVLGQGYWFGRGYAFGLSQFALADFALAPSQFPQLHADLHARFGVAL